MQVAINATVSGGRVRLNQFLGVVTHFGATELRVCSPAECFPRGGPLSASDCSSCGLEFVPEHTRLSCSAGSC